MSASLRFGLLGPVMAWRGDTPLELGPPQQRLVLAALLLARRRLSTTDQLIEAVWGDDPPRTALTTLRTYVSRLRVVLGDTTVASVSGGYAITDGELDVDTAEDLARSARQAPDINERLRLLTEAVSLWRDVPLSGMAGAFVQAQRERLIELRLTTMELLLTVQLELGDCGSVITRLTPLCSEYPFRERLRGLLMLALHRAGRRAEALATYEDLRQQLADQLGIDPGNEITGLHGQILANDRSLAVAAVNTPRSPALPRPAQLPADIGDFTGRTELAASLARSVVDGTHRIVALSGIGGVGKTTLALHVAHQVRKSFPDGQLYIDLRGAEPEPPAPATVLARFLRALGVERHETPHETVERTALFQSTVADMRILVVLDNAADVAQLMPLLPGSSRCAVLVTSRRKLTGLAGAHRVDMDVLEPDEALRLFAGIVGRQRMRDEAAAALDVVAACGFLPLAVRIAAARLTSRAHWSITDLATRLAGQQRRLRELRTGDQTVTAAFALSYRQLDEEHARALRLLAVPELGQLGIDEAAALLEVAPSRAEDLVGALTELSLLESPSPAHLRFHDLLRLFGSQQASPAEHRQALERLLRHYLSTACAAKALLEPELGSRMRELSFGRVPVAFPSLDAAARWLDTESPNLLLVIRQFIRDGIGDAALVANLLYVICDWSQAGANRQMYLEITRAVAELAGEIGDGYAEARTRLALTDTLVMWHPREVSPQAFRVRQLAEQLGDDLMFAEATMMLADGMSNAHTGSLEQMLAYRDEAARRLESKPGYGELAARLNLTRARDLANLGRVDEAYDISTEMLARLRRIGSSGSLARTLLSHSHVVAAAHGPAAAIAIAEEGLELAVAIRDRPLEMLALWRVAGMRLESGHLTEAVAFAERTIIAADAVGDDYKHAQALVILGKALWNLGQADRARACLADAVVPLDRHREVEADQVRALIAVYSGAEQRDGKHD